MQSHFDGLEDIQNRLLRLEKQNRRLKQLGAGVLIASASLIVMGQIPSKKAVEANEFILRDDGGKVRVRLAVNAKHAYGAPEMVFFDDKGNARLLF
jgi:hypothetical protein